MYRKISAFLVTALSVIALIPAPAQAAPVPLGHCYVNKICFWSGTNFRGSEISFYIPPSGLVRECTDSGINGQVKSIENNTNYSFEVFNRSICTGATKVGTIYPKTANNNTSSPSWNEWY